MATGPCKKCGCDDRSPSGACRACNRAASAKRRANSPEKVKAARDKYQAANRDKVNADSAAWRANNRALFNQIAKAYRVNNRAAIAASQQARIAADPARRAEIRARYRKRHPEKMRAEWRARRAKKRQNGGALSAGLERKLFTLQRGKCACCGKLLGRDFHMDHIMPLALGGRNSDENMQLLRKLCNLKKNAKHPIDYMQSKGFLL